MRIGNSFSHGEIDLLTQVLGGLTTRGKDLTHLTRHPDFALLVGKVKAMAAKVEGAPVVPRKPLMREGVLKFITENPGLSTPQIAAVMGRDSHHVGYDITNLMRDKRIERVGGGNTQRYYARGKAPNVVRLVSRPAVNGEASR